MKKNINLLGLVCLLIFSIFFSESIFAQTISKTFTKEISVKPEGKLTFKGKTIDLIMNGRINVGYSENGYTTRAGKNKLPVLTIEDVFINTWEKSKIKYEVAIKITPRIGEEAIAEQLLKDIKLELVENNLGQVHIENNLNLNIKTLQILNGFFRKDINNIILNNNKSYAFQTIEINANLTIPKTHNLDADIEYININLDDLDSHVRLAATGSKIKGGKINELAANILFGELTFDEIKKASLNAHYSTISIATIEELTLGDKKFAMEGDIGSLMNNMGKRLSNQNKYVINKIGLLNIMESTNDKFYLGSVENLYSPQSIFSNYTIDTLIKSVDLKAKNGDLLIKQVNPSFEKIDIFNKTSTINIGLKNTPNYLFNIGKNSMTEFNLTKDISLIDSNIFGTKSYLKGNKEKAGKINIRCNQCDVKFNE